MMLYRHEKFYLSFRWLSKLNHKPLFFLIYKKKLFNTWNRCSALQCWRCWCS